MRYRECEFQLDAITLRGRRWGTEGGKAVMALHGWLDNCASFDFLAPLISDTGAGGYDIVALDLAGHGLSDHRAGLSAYNIWQDIIEILQVAEQLGWTEFALIGHSRGGMVATLFAATYPEKVTHLAAIEGFTPSSASEEEAPGQLRMALDSIRNLSRKPFNVHPSFDAAVKARERGLVPLVHPDALVLARRGVKQNEQGFYWCNDQKLLAPSEFKLTPGQVKAFINRLCNGRPEAASQRPVALLVVSSRGITDLYPEMLEWIKQYPQIRVQPLEGDHHLHMSAGAQAVSRLITDYFQL